MPGKPVGELIAEWRDRIYGVAEDALHPGETLEFEYVHIDELYITPNGPVERRGVLYHPAGAPNNPAILDDHVRPVIDLEMDGLQQKYSLNPDQMNAVRSALRI